LLGQNLHLAVKELRSHIGPVVPNECLHVRIDVELPETIDILQRLEDLALQFVSEIDLAFGPVVESEPDQIVAKILGFAYVEDH
jgi:hypothetical protein